MTIDEIRELLPFYAAGTLESNERKLVDEALKNSAELREELTFWRHAKAATILRADIKSEFHLTSEQIVDYANGGVESGTLRNQIENHLQSCTACRKEHDLIKEMQPERPRANRGPSVRRPVSSFFLAGFKPGFVVLALALLAIILVVVFMREPQRREAVNEQPKDSTISPLKTAKRTVALVFPYVGSMREPGTKKKSIPILTTDQATDTVRLVLPVQHSALASAYRVQIVSPTKGVVITDTIAAGSFGNGLDSVPASIDIRLLALQGRYVANVRELIKSNEPEIEPEEYRYEFELRKN